MEQFWPLLLRLFSFKGCTVSENRQNYLVSYFREAPLGEGFKSVCSHWRSCFSSPPATYPQTSYLTSHHISHSFIHQSPASPFYRHCHSLIHVIVRISQSPSLSPECARNRFEPVAVPLFPSLFSPQSHDLDSLVLINIPFFQWASSPPSVTANPASPPQSHDTNQLLSPTFTHRHSLTVIRSESITDRQSLTVIHSPSFYHHHIIVGTT